MKKGLFVLSIFLLFPAFARSDNGDEKKESFYEQISRAVIRFEHVGHTKQEGSDNIQCRTVSDGTGFFVASEKHLYVVSARHVVEKDYDLHARVRSKKDKTGEIEVIHLRLPKERWIYHTDHGDKDTRYVDVAAQKIHRVKDRKIKHFRYESEDSKDFDKNQLPFADADPPQPILVFGFPLDIGFQLLEQRPFARQGIISMKTGKKFIEWDGKFAEQKCSLIDVEIFKGNSGSPVMNEIGPLSGGPKLLGLVIASNNRMDFAVMEPVSRIREVLDLAKEQSTEGLNFWYPIDITAR